MAFTKEVFDFSKLEPKSIEKQLADLNIPLTVQEVLKIQKEMLGRAPSLAELVFFQSKDPNIVAIRVAENT